MHTDAPNIVNGPLILDTSRNSPAEAIAKRASAGEISSPAAVAATHRMPAGGRVIRRQAVDAGAPAASFYSSLSSGDYEGAVRYLSALSEPDMRAELRVLPVDTRGRLRDAALRLDPSGTSPVVRVIEDIENNNPPEVSGPSAAPATPIQPAPVDIASLSATEKLSRAGGFAMDGVKGEAERQLAELLSPRSLAMMAFVAGLFIGAQVTPVGWVADAFLLAGLTISLFFVGRVILDIVRDLVRYFSAVNATSEPELRASGQALAEAIVLGGIVLILELIAHMAGRTGGGQPGEGPRPSGAAEATGAPRVRRLVTPEGFEVDVIEGTPAQAEALASSGVLMSVSSGVGGSSGGDGSQEASESPTVAPFEERLTQEVIEEMSIRPGGEYAETWELEYLEGPHKFAETDPSLPNAPNAQPYQARFRDFTGNVEDISVNYDPDTGRFGTIKRASGR